MTSKIATTMARKLGAKKAQAWEPPDPHYETFTDERGRERKRKRAMPPGLTAEEARILKSVRRRSHYLDKGFHICGIRFGWTFLIGLIPVLGSATDAALGYKLVIAKCKTADIPNSLLTQMQLNTLFATGVSFIPIAGDIIMAAFKPNSRNANLFEAWLTERAANRGHTDVEAQGQEIVTAAKQGRWSKKTGSNSALLAQDTAAGYGTTDPSEAAIPSGSNTNSAGVAAPALPARPR